MLLSPFGRGKGAMWYMLPSAVDYLHWPVWRGVKYGLASSLLHWGRDSPGGGFTRE